MDYWRYCRIQGDMILTLELSYSIKAFWVPCDEILFASDWCWSEWLSTRFRLWRFFHFEIEFHKVELSCGVKTDDCGTAGVWDRRLLLSWCLWTHMGFWLYRSAWFLSHHMLLEWLLIGSVFLALVCCWRWYFGGTCCDRCGGVARFLELPCRSLLLE